MNNARNDIGGLGNLLFKEAFIIAQMLDGDIPDVYLQDESYFKKYEKQIRAKFSAGITSLSFVSIHVRRGDYVGSKFHTDLSESDYYERAVEYFPDKRFLLFSDDREWCFKRFPDTERFIIANQNDEATDLNLMASCESNIIANSSFSWWGGWLNPNPNKIVIAPKDYMWFQDKVARTKLPKEWITI